MEDALATKAARLQKVVHLLYRNPAGLATAELARHCAVTVRTVQRDLKDLEAAGIPLWEEAGRYGITAGYYLPPVHFSLEEASAPGSAPRPVAMLEPAGRVASGGPTGRGLPATGGELPRASA